MRHVFLFSLAVGILSKTVLSFAGIRRLIACIGFTTLDSDGLQTASL
jgi:hypothetical protein